MNDEQECDSPDIQRDEAIDEYRDRQAEDRERFEE